MSRFTQWLFLTLTLSMIAKADNLPKAVMVPLDTAFTPVGFDDNDRAQIAVAGTFPNSCYRVGPYALRIDEDEKTITVQQQAYVYGGMCLQMFTPYTQVIDLGLLSEGDYKVLDRASGKNLGTLSVAKGKNIGPDDFLYAPITDAYISMGGNKNTLVLSGSFSDRCSDFEDIKVLYQDRVLVVQPIMKRAGEGSPTCGPAKTRFLKMIELKEGLHGVFMLHVRSLDGQAINRIVDIP